jgi:predicted nucleic acid-binding protein
LIYVDTSAIVAALDTSDPRMKKAREFLERWEDKIVSELVIVELASVLSRRHDLLASMAERLGVSESLAFTALILYILKRFNLRYIPVKGFSRTLFGRFYTPIAYAVALAERLKLKTLDLLHLAYIRALKVQGIPIKTILTADADFKSREKHIEEMLGVTVELIA